jgi:hypothetical protein
LKRLVLGLGVVLLPLAVAAQPLVIGVVRDQDGAVIPGARIAGRDASGKVVATAQAAADGTFALEASAIASVDVQCDYCAPLHAAPVAQPLVLFVTRYRALITVAPNEFDLAALPYARAENAAALQPFALARPGSVSFGLDRGASLISTAGISSYRIADGGTALTTLPDRYLESLTTVAQTQGYRYGSYGDGGAFDFEPIAGERAALRVDGGPDESAALRYATPGLAAAAGASYGWGVHQSRADLIATSAVAGGTLRTIASLAGTSQSEDYSALGVQYATASRRYETFLDADVSGSRLDPSYAYEYSPVASGSSTFVDFRVRNRGPLGLEFGARFRNSTGSYLAPESEYQAAGSQQEGAVYSDISFNAAGNTVLAAAGLTRLYRGGYGYYTADTLVAPLGSFDYAYAFGPHFSLSAAASALPRIPTLAEEGAYGMLFHSTIPIDRDQLLQSGFSYTDLSRLRAEVEAYREQIVGAGTSIDAGVGFSIGWQIAPVLALRAWTLQPTQNLAGAYAAYASYAPYAATLPARASSVWLTYDPGARIDAIYYSGRIDGDVNLPIGPHTTFRIGRDSSSGAPRYSFGVRAER